ncbi:MAG: LacI family DNA-binding transcriptional regulator, partial [Burkholderiaceae bacterium]
MTGKPAAPPTPPASSSAVAARRPRASGRVTLQDVAQAAGVSPITVSRALRGERAVAAELVERVQQAVAQLGYVPDPAARALASSRSSQVAVLIPLLSNALFVDLLDAVQRALLRAGYQTLIGVTHYEPAEEEALLRSYLLHRPAGLIVTGFDRTPAARKLIENSGVPCVHVMETVAAEGVYSVGFSQSDAG